MNVLTRFFSNLLAHVPEGHMYYCGSYHDGEARYTYLPSDKGHVFDGDFSFDQRLGRGAYRRAQGQFVENLKQGKWLFTRKGQTRSMKLEVDFVDGRLDGDLTYTCKTETVGGIVFTGLGLTLSDGKVKGEITGLINGGDFKGYCDDHGKADGTWTLITDTDDGSEIVRTEVWEHGVLIETYEEDRKGTVKTNTSSKALHHINFILEEDCNKLLSIVRRGTVSKLATIA